MEMALLMDRPAKNIALSIKTALSVDRRLEFGPVSTRTHLSVDRGAMEIVLPGWIGPDGAFF